MFLCLYSEEEDISTDVFAPNFICNMAQDTQYEVFVFCLLVAVSFQEADWHVWGWSDFMFSLHSHIYLDQTCVDNHMHTNTCTLSIYYALRKGHNVLTHHIIFPKESAFVLPY